MSGNIVTYFDSFGVESFAKDIKIFMQIKKNITNIYLIQVYNSVMNK